MISELAYTPTEMQILSQTTALSSSCHSQQSTIQTTTIATAISPPLSFRLHNGWCARPPWWFACRSKPCTFPSSRSTDLVKQGLVLASAHFREKADTWQAPPLGSVGAQHTTSIVFPQAATIISSIYNFFFAMINSPLKTIVQSLGGFCTGVRGKSMGLGASHGAKSD